MIEAVVDPNEPPCPANATLDQAWNLAKALAKRTGESSRRWRCKRSARCVELVHRRNCLDLQLTWPEVGKENTCSPSSYSARSKNSNASPANERYSRRTLLPPRPEPGGRLAEGIHGEVRFDAGSRALYATDGSNYRQVPIGVVVPQNR